MKTLITLFGFLPVCFAATPSRLSGNDWSGIRAEYVRHRQAAFPVEGGHQARNYAQRWITRFDGRGFEVTPDGGGWQWGLQLQSYGFAGQERSVARARVGVDVEKVGYRWDAAIEEWFVNGPSGLEQGFTLSSRPGDAASALVLHLGVRGTLTPRVSSDGRWVSFVDDRGAAMLNYAGLKATDAVGRELPARFTREQQGLRLEVDERGAHYPITIDPLAQQGYLKPSAVGMTQSVDWFGYSVAVSGDTVVVGAHREDSSTLGINSSPDELAGSAGAAYVFTRSGGVWSQQAYLKPAAVGPGGDSGDQFGFSVAISGDTVVVGAISEDSSSTGVNSTPVEGASNAGAVYVFIRTGGVWTQQAYLKPPVMGISQASTGFEFGWSVAISGDTIAVGAYDEPSSSTGVNSTYNELAPGAGAAYVFTRSGTTWSQQAYLKPAAVGTTQSNDHFGNSIAVSGDTVVVGAFQEDSSSIGVNSTPNEAASASGAAYVFARSGGVWTQQAYLKPGAVGTTQAGDVFGISVGVSGDTVIVGASGEDSNTLGINGATNELSADSGAAYVFSRSAGVWTQQAFLKPTAVGTTQNSDNFGISVGISGGVIVVGASGEASSTTGINTSANESAGTAGAAYVFTRTAGVWSQQAYLKPAAIGTTQAGDNFGFAVAVSGDTAVVGAYLEDSGTLGVNTSANESSTDSGTAYTFLVPLPPVSVTVNTSPTGLLFSSSGAGCAPGSNYTAPQVLQWTPGSSCTLSVATPQSGHAFARWEDASTNPVRAITAPASDASYKATFTPSGATDFDGDHKGDFGVYNPNGTWTILRSANGLYSIGWGGPGWTPVQGDYDGDGKADIAVYNGGTWSIIRSSDSGNTVFGWGGPSWTPVAADYDGDGKADIAVYQAGAWSIVRSSDHGNTTFGWGGPSWTPVPADYDGDGKADIAVYNAGAWSIVRSSDGGNTVAGWGGPAWTAVPGDYDGDGKADIAVYNATGTWSIVRSSDSVNTVVAHGGSGWVPVPADYDGDGKTDIAVYNTSSGQWSIRRSSDNGNTIVNLGGAAGDVPLK